MTRQTPEDTCKESFYLTPEAVRRAVALVAPMIEKAREDRQVVGSGFLYLVVMDPARPSGECDFEEAILHEEAFGDRTQWDADYAAFARAKARLSWITGRDGHVVQHLLPQLLRNGDTVLTGGICMDGIVVGASGAFPVFDEMFAGALALALRAVARQARAAERAALTLSSAERGVA